MILVTLPYFPQEWQEWDWPDEITTLMRDDAHVWITDPHHPILKDDLVFYPNLKLVITASTGDNHIPLDALEEHDIAFRSLLDRRGELNEIKGSSEFCFFMILAALRNAKDAFLEAKRWDKHREILRGNELYGRQVGIIGMGRIGSNVYKYCRAFDADVRHIYDLSTPHAHIEQLFSECDVVVVSCSLNDETRGMVTEELLELLPKGAVLVNVSRGEVIDEEALVRVLLRRPDLRVAVDVLAGEVTGAHLSSRLLGMHNVTVTPHVAGLTYEANEKAALIALDLAKEWYGETIS